MQRPVIIAFDVGEELGQGPKRGEQFPNWSGTNHVNNGADEGVRAPSQLGRVMAWVADTELNLDLVNLLQHHFETIFAEFLVLNPFEVFP